MADRPIDFKYLESHEWIDVDGDEATVGITDFAVEHLGELVFVDLPEVGSRIEAGDNAAEVESVKAVGEIISPVTGEVTAVNDGLGDDQGPLSADPFGEGWLFKVKVESLSDELLDLEAYEKQLDAS